MTHPTPNQYLACCEQPIDDFSLRASSDLFTAQPVATTTHIPPQLNPIDTPEIHHKLTLAADEMQAFNSIVEGVARETSVRALMGTLLSARDERTLAHGYRVGALMTAVSLSLGLCEKEAAIGCRIGMLHDIGKAHPSVHNAVYSDRPLDGNPELFTLIRKHPGYGVMMASRAPGISKNVLQGIGNHHALRDPNPYGVFNTSDLVSFPENDGCRPDVKRLINLVASCDVLDALTVEPFLRSRPYQGKRQEQYSPDHAIRALGQLQIPDALRQAVINITELKN
jgi:hypothetical protein